MIVEVEAKTLLSRAREPDPYFGIRYTMNLYRGCQHHCIYCDSRSLCYGIGAFDRDVLVKVNAPELLERELAGKLERGTIGTGSMNDPYLPLERQQRLTRRALEILARRRFPVHVITKSSLVQRDLDLLQDIGRVYSAVSFSITTLDDRLGRQLEPGAPLPSERLAAMAALAGAGVYTGLTLMPVLPFIEDDEVAVLALVRRAAECGASYVLAWFSVTLRDRQREHFYRRLDRWFLGLRQRYQATFGSQYECRSPHASRLYDALSEACLETGLAPRMRFYQPAGCQMSLFA